MSLMAWLGILVPALIIACLVMAWFSEILYFFEGVIAALRNLPKYRREEKDVTPSGPPPLPDTDDEVEG